MRYLLAYYTDKGKIKSVNQDSLLVVQANYEGDNVVLAVVCDGIGGLERGEWASANVTNSFARWFQKEMQGLVVQEEFEDALYDSWEILLQKAHLRIKEYGRVRNIQLGTTVTAMLFWHENYYIAHIGDCRIYEIRNQIILLTKDQVQEGLRIKNHTDGIERKRVNTEKHVLLQGVGASKVIRPTYYSGKAKENAVYLLCTDGFRNRVSSQELHEAFKPEKLVNEKIMAQRGKRITEIVMDRGEKDNISVLLVRTVQNRE